MQTLRHVSRGSGRGIGLLKSTVGQGDVCRVPAFRSYCSEVSSNSKQRKSKEERHALVMQFVKKYRASNKGQLPGITLVRKEVGGSYQILKEILQDLEKEHGYAGTLEHAAAVDGTTDSVSAERDDLALNVETGAASPTTESDSHNPTSAQSHLLHTESISRKVNKTSKVSTDKTIAAQKSAPIKGANVAQVEEHIVQKRITKGAQKGVPADIAKPAQVEEDSIHVQIPKEVWNEATAKDAKVPQVKQDILPGKMKKHAQKIFPVEDAKVVRVEEDIVEGLSEQGLSDTCDEDDDDIAAPEYGECESPIEQRMVQSSDKDTPFSTETSVILKSVPPSVTTKDIREAFADCGEIVSCNVFHMSIYWNSPKGGPYYGTVTFKTVDGFCKARDKKQVVLKDVVVEIEQVSKQIKFQECHPIQTQHSITTGNTKSIDIEGREKLNTGRKQVVLKDAVVEIEQVSKQIKFQESHPIQTQHSVTTGNTKSIDIEGREKLITGSKSFLESTIEHDRSGMANQNYHRLWNPLAIRIKNVPSHVSSSHLKEALSKYGEINNLTPFVRGTAGTTYIVWFKSDQAVRCALNERQLKVGDRSYQLQKQANPWTSVVRMSNIPTHVTENKLRSTCEKIAGVVGLEMRRGGIADIHFDVKTYDEMENVVQGLGKVNFGGEFRLKLSQAPRFFCGHNPGLMDKHQKPQHVKQLKDTVLKHFERHIDQLSTHLQDFRELVAMQQEMLRVSTKPFTANR